MLIPANQKFILPTEFPFHALAFAPFRAISSQSLRVRLCRRPSDSSESLKIHFDNGRIIVAFGRKRENLLLDDILLTLSQPNREISPL